MNSKDILPLPTLLIIIQYYYYTVFTKSANAMYMYSKKVIPWCNETVDVLLNPERTAFTSFVLWLNLNSEEKSTNNWQLYEF